MDILDGSSLAKKILEELKTKIHVKKIKAHLATIIIGGDPASRKYVEMKKKTGEEIGITNDIYKYDDQIDQCLLIGKINELNQDNSVDGILVQLPLPDHLNKYEILNTISVKKDVDGLTAINLGKLFQKITDIPISATAMGIFTLLTKYGIEIRGKNIAIINNSPLIGIPLMGLFNRHGGTVTVCHIDTLNLAKITRESDIVVSAVGIKNFIKADMIKNGVVLVGAGLERDKTTGKMCGDLDFEHIKDKCSFITPNIGGVGPMTIACLYKNLIDFCKI